MTDQNNLAALQQLYDEGQEYEIGKDTDRPVKVKVYKLGIDQLALMESIEGLPMAEKVSRANKLFAAALQVEEEDVKIPIDYFEDLTAAIRDRHKVMLERMNSKATPLGQAAATPNPTGTGKIKSFIQQKQELMAKQAAEQKAKEEAAPTPAA